MGGIAPIKARLGELIGITANRSSEGITQKRARFADQPPQGKEPNLTAQHQSNGRYKPPDINWILCKNMKEP